ncbi:unnamed protein product, partial [Phaeothamnion confervicola]
MDEKKIARRITADPHFKGMSGQFDRARFDYLIRQAGLTEQRFLAEQRRNSVRQQLLGTVTGEVTVPKVAAEAMNRYQNETRAIDFVILDRAQAGDVPDPSPEALAKYFEERKVLFRAPEYRKVDLLVLTPTALAGTAEISDEDARKAYAARQDKYVTAERRQLAQIVFPNMDEAKAGAEKIAKGASFADLATERGLKDADIDLGTVTKSAMVDRTVADIAFALKEGEVSAPVDGRFGAALVQVIKVEAGHTRPYEEVAAELKQELATERARAEVAGVHDKIEDERLAGASLADIAAKLKLKLRTIE